MKDIYELPIDGTFPSELTGGAVSIGNFDGVHRGHQALIAVLREEARRVGGPAVVVTFDPHPLRLLGPERFMPLLTTVVDRSAELLRAGVDGVVVLRTTAELLRIDAQSFAETLILQRLKANAVVEGFNFAFGRDRVGTTEFLQRWCGDNNVACTIVPAATGTDGQPISSSRVRAALDCGDVEGASKLLGRPYRLRGVVVEGDRRGASLGFPTANLSAIQTVIPGDGVYAVRVRGEFGEQPGACNVGPNPTFGVESRKVEVHVIGWTGNLYGQELTIEFVARLRETQRFESKDKLVQQLQADVERARQLNRESEIAEFLRAEIAPAFAIESAALELLEAKDGVVKLRMNGACASCPATIMTLISGIEQELRKRFPEIEYLEAVP